MISRTNHTILLTIILLLLSSYTVIAVERDAGIRDLIREVHELIRTNKEAGRDVSQAMELDNKARRLMKSGNETEAKKVLSEAVSLLNLAKASDASVTPKSPVLRPLEESKQTGDMGIPSYNYSPFGFMAPYIGQDNATATEYLSDIGCKWVRLIEPEVDRVKEELYKRGINLLVGISPERSFPSDTEAYKNRIKTFVAKDKAKVIAWYIGNEPDAMWKDTPEKFVELLRLSYTTIKGECRECIVVMGGLADSPKTAQSKGVRFLDTVLQNGGGNYFDVFDFHHIGVEQGYVNIKKSVDIYKDVFKKHGVQMKPVWITELSTYDGDPAAQRNMPDFPYQSEMDQASGLVKRYVYSLYAGIDKMFWVTLMEWEGKQYFNNVGVIHNPKTDGKMHKKLAYYAYKKTAEILEGADFKNIQKVMESDGTYIFKFTKNGHIFYIAWSDNSDKDVSITLSKGARGAKGTKMIPEYDSGNDVKDYSTAFEQIAITVEQSQNFNSLEIKFTSEKRPAVISEY